MRVKYEDLIDFELNDLGDRGLEFLIHWQSPAIAKMTKQGDFVTLFRTTLESGTTFTVREAQIIALHEDHVYLLGAQGTRHTRATRIFHFSEERDKVKARVFAGMRAWATSLGARDVGEVVLSPQMELFE